MVKNELYTGEKDNKQSELVSKNSELVDFKVSNFLSPIDKLFLNQKNRSLSTHNFNIKRKNNHFSIFNQNRSSWLNEKNTLSSNQNDHLEFQNTISTKNATNKDSTISMRRLKLFENQYTDEKQKLCEKNLDYLNESVTIDFLVEEEIILKNSV